MRATGIVRRIDELGRVVIPKEIRRTLRIREGDPSQSSFIKVLDLIININTFANNLRTPRCKT